MKNRILSIAIVLLFVLSLCSCSAVTGSVDNNLKNGTYLLSENDGAYIKIQDEKIDFYLNNKLNGSGTYTYQDGMLYVTSDSIYDGRTLVYRDNCLINLTYKYFKTAGTYDENANTFDATFKCNDEYTGSYEYHSNSSFINYVPFFGSTVPKSGTYNKKGNLITLHWENGTSMYQYYYNGNIYEAYVYQG